MQSMAKAGGCNGKGRRLLCNCWVKKYSHNTKPFYNSKPTISASRILGKWADLAAVVAFWFSRIIAVNFVAFPNDCWFPFLGPRKERLYS
jgi:hypothetical protein